MSRIPYEISNKISFHLQWPSQLYRAIFDILIESDGLGIVLCHASMDKLLVYAKGKSVRVTPESSYFVFRHVVFRTLQFNKALEFIRTKDVIKGMPTISVAGCGLSKSTIERTLKISSGADCLIKLRLHPSQAVTPLYGLNLPLFLKLVDVWWEVALLAGAQDGDQLEKSLLAKRARNLLEICIEYLEHFEPAFKYLTSYQKTISNVEDFINEFVKHLPERHSRPCGRELREELRCCRKRWY